MPAVRVARDQVKADGWTAAHARRATHYLRRIVRLRVHEACVIDADERIGYSALTSATCDRCRTTIRGAAVMVQLR
jgi:16S rRNA U1498 N3-methylase RsmE